MNIGLLGPAAALCFAAMGSAFGSGIAAQSAVGAWKKRFLNDSTAPFMMVAFSGAPLTQTIYGYLLMNFIRTAAENGVDSMVLLGAGLFGGLAMGASALMQGKTAAAASDALGATGKGTANYFIVIGIVETVALFVMVFLMLTLQ